MCLKHLGQAKERKTAGTWDRDDEESEDVEDDQAEEACAAAGLA